MNEMQALAFWEAVFLKVIDNDGMTVGQAADIADDAVTQRKRVLVGFGLGIGGAYERATE